MGHDHSTSHSNRSKSLHHDFCLESSIANNKIGYSTRLSVALPRAPSAGSDFRHDVNWKSKRSFSFSTCVGSLRAQFWPSRQSGASLICYEIIPSTPSPAYTRIYRSLLDLIIRIITNLLPRLPHTFRIAPLLNLTCFRFVLTRPAFCSLCLDC